MFNIKSDIIRGTVYSIPLDVALRFIYRYIEGWCRALNLLIHLPLRGQRWNDYAQRRLRNCTNFPFNWQ